MNQGNVLATIARYTVLSALFLIPFIPLYVANDLFFPFITGKAFAFRILVELAAGGYLVLALAEPKYRPRFSWTLALYGAFVLWMLIADLAGMDPHKAIWSNFERMDGWVTLIHVFLFFVVAGAVLSVDKLWSRWWQVFIGVAALMCAYGLLQITGGVAIHQGSTRVDSRFGNAIYFAAYLLFAGAASVWQALRSQGWVRYLFIALAVVDAFFIFETETRGAIFGLAVGIAVASVLWMLESGKGGRRIAAGLLALVIIATGGLFLARESSFVQHNSTLTRIASAFNSAELTTRMTLWHMAFEGVAARPVLGWGQEGFNYVFQKYYEPSLYAQEPWFDRAHNEYIDWLVAGGVPALLLFLGAFLAAAWAIYKSGASREERVLLLAALAAYAAQGMTVFDNLFTYIPFAVILAMAHGYSARPIRRIASLPALSERTLQIAGPVALVLTLVVLWFVNVPNIATANQLVRALSLSGTDITTNVELFQKALAEPTFAHQEVREQLVIFATNIAAAQQHSSDALTQLLNFSQSEMKKEVAAEPKDARLRLEYALGFRYAGDISDALAQLEIARTLAPKKQALLLEEGTDYWQAGDYAKAHDAFLAAYQLYPAATSYAPYVAGAQIAGGDLAGGKAFLMSAIGTTTVNNEALILGYYQAKDMQDLVLCFEQKVREEDTAEAMLRLASAYAIAGRNQDARNEVSAAIAQHPEAAASGGQLLSHIPAQ